MWEEVATEEEARLAEEEGAQESEPSAAEQLADEQLLGLVRQLYLAGWPKPMRQVVFSGIRENADSAALCLRIAEALANQITARVCLVETERRADSEQLVFGGARADVGDTPEPAGAVRASSLQLKRNLWLVPVTVWRSAEDAATLPWVRRRLGELRSEFDYAVIHAPPAGTSGEAETLARLTDGLVLVVEAHRTRRVSARATQQKLQAANVQILGAILSGRTFPIPERLYRRL
jgi:hypothetical protein